MGLVIAGLAGIALIFLVVWLIALATAATADRQARAQEEAEAAETKRLADRDSRMRIERIQLRCMNCDHIFVGPLTDDGCPNCHLSALVVPELEYRQTQKQSGK